jgi:hypothetical protein
MGKDQLACSKKEFGPGVAIHERRQGRNNETGPVG